MKKPFENRQSGFTLIEVLVVVIIVAILAAVAFPIYQSYVKSAYASDAQATIGAIMNASKMYYQDNGTYPNEVDELEPKYLQIDRATKRAWTFTIIASDKAVQEIKAMSTEDMKQGAGNEVVYDAERGKFTGYGFDEGTAE